MRRLWLIPAILWTAVIFSFSASTGTESASLSLAIAEKVKGLWESVFPSASIDISILHAIIRKAAHVTEYLILGILWSLAIRPRGWYFLCLVGLGLVIASFDEGIQMFYEGRNPSFTDVLLFDWPGFLIGSGICFLCSSRKKRLR